MHRYLTTFGRGVVYGLVAAGALFVSAQLQRDHYARLTYLAVTAGFAALGGLVLGGVGTFYWVLAHGDVLSPGQWRQSHSRYDGTRLLAPLLVVTAGAAVPLFVTGVIGYDLVQDASYGGLLY